MKLYGCIILQIHSLLVIAIGNPDLSSCFFEYHDQNNERFADWRLFRFVENLSQLNKTVNNSYVGKAVSC